MESCCQEVDTLDALRPAIAAHERRNAELALAVDRARQSGDGARDGTVSFKVWLRNHAHLSQSRGQGWMFGRPQPFDGSSVLLSAFQDASHFTPHTVHRYERLAVNRSKVGAIATGMSHRPAENVRGGSLPPDHPLCGEQTVIVVGPHDAAALIALDLGDSGPDGCRRFEYVITHDRPTVIAAGRCLLQYIDPR